MTTRRRLAVVPEQPAPNQIDPLEIVARRMAHLVGVHPVPLRQPRPEGVTELGRLSGEVSRSTMLKVRGAVMGLLKE